MTQRFALAVAISVLIGATVSATDFYVAPNGSASGAGSLASPWDLKTALQQPSSVHPGDTIWLRGGTYTGIHTSYLNGTSASPIVVRQYPGENATLDGGNSNGVAILTVGGSYTWFWGFEIMSSDPKRHSAQAGSWPTDIERGDGVASAPTSSSGIKLINLTIHDARQGVSAFSAWSDTEIYGCLIYNNGWEGTESYGPRGNGHGIYTQNQSGTKHITDNIIFSGFAYGIHAYGSSAAYLDNFTIEGNTIFQSGTLEDQNARNLLIGGGSLANNPAVLHNSLYRAGPNSPASDFDLGYSAGCLNASVTDNYIASNSYFVRCLPVSMTGNTFAGNTSGFSPPAYPDNTYDATPPPGAQVSVRPNLYETGRANITVFNWGGAEIVSVDLSAVAYVGGAYQIRNAQDFFGAPVVSGTYDGLPVSLPMTGLSVAAPVGWATPAATGPDFNSFVLFSLPGPNDFFDVAPNNPFHSAITKVASNGITAGCGGGNFCPDSTVRRDQMAVFLLKSEHGSSYAPPSATGAVFDDVPTTAFAAAWIEQVAGESITGGCGSGDYCPGDAVTRAQMAVLLLKTLLGPSYVPPAAKGTVFSDVPKSAFAAAWIEDLAARGITAGCGSGHFCPTNTVNRAQMAAFLANTFNLQ